MSKKKINSVIIKIRKVLTDSFKGAQTEIKESETSGKIFGFLIWKRFVGVDQLKRQQRMWKVLTKKLTRHEQIQISAIFATTSEERTIVHES